MPLALLLLPAEVEELEAVAPIDILRRAKVEVVTAALGDSTVVTGRSSLTLQAETTLGAWGDRLADAIILPGGPGTRHLRADARVRALLLAHHAAGRLVAAICAAPTVLHDAGLLTGRAHTAHPSTAAELPLADPDHAVVEDGPIVTSRGAGTAVAFGLALAARLASPSAAEAVRVSICAPRLP